MDDTTLEAQWVVDSETGLKVLIDIHTNKIIARKDKNGRLIDAL